MANLNEAHNPVIPPRDLKLSLELSFDTAMDQIQKWVREQGIVGVEEVDIGKKSKELHGKWLDAKNSRDKLKINCITFN